MKRIILVKVLFFIKLILITDIGAFRCDNGKQIRNKQFCNKRDDCGDRSDESPSYGCHSSNSKNTSQGCGSGKLMCDSKTCMDVALRCNGIIDCIDKSDEQNCAEQTRIQVQPENCPLEQGKFLCKNKWACLDFSLVCNNQCNCIDCSDEHEDNCFKLDSESCSSCTQYCLPTPDGPQCICNSTNYETSSLCKEIQNCAQELICDQHCTRYRDFQRCLCYDGYQEVPGSNGQKCQNVSAIRREAVLIYSTVTKIKFVNLDKNTIQIAQNGVYCTALSAARDYMYYASLRNNKGYIYKSPMMENDVNEKIVQVDSRVTSIAIDWITNNVYFTSNESLSVCTNNTKVCTILKCCEINNVVVAPKFGRMFYMQNTLRGENDQFIMKSNMDGSEEDMLLPDDSFLYPVSFTIDELTQTLFWLEIVEQKLHSVSLDGSNRQIQFLGNDFSSLTVLENIFYFTKHRDNSFYRSEVFPQVEKYQDNATSSIRHLHILSPALQRTQEMENPCVEASCTSLCLISPSLHGLNYTCLCENFTPISDDKWCDKDKDYSVQNNESSPSTTEPNENSTTEDSTHTTTEQSSTSTTEPNANSTTEDYTHTTTEQPSTSTTEPNANSTTEDYTHTTTEQSQSTTTQEKFYSSSQTEATITSTSDHITSSTTQSGNQETHSPTEYIMNLCEKTDLMQAKPENTLLRIVCEDVRKYLYLIKPTVTTNSSKSNPSMTQTGSGTIYSSTLEPTSVLNAFDYVLIYSTVTKIKAWYLSTGEHRVIQEGVDCTALRGTREHIYYATASDNECGIFKSSTNSEKKQSPTQIISTDSLITTIAIDWITNNVYFTTNVSLSVCSREGKICTELKCCDTDAVTLAPSFRWMFYSRKVVSDDKYVIVKSGMDGSEVQILFDESFSQLGSLTADEPTETLFWIETLEPILHSVTFYGNRKKATSLQNLNSDLLHNSYFTILEQNVFYTVGYNGIKWQSPQHSGGFYKDDSTNSVKFLHAYKNSSRNINTIENPCEFSSCSGLCLLHPGLPSFSCICENFTPTDENRWCNKKPLFPVVLISNATSTYKCPNIHTLTETSANFTSKHITKSTDCSSITSHSLIASGVTGFISGISSTLFIILAYFLQKWYKRKERQPEERNNEIELEG